MKPYAEQLVLDRRVSLIADPDAAESPVIHGRICVAESASRTVLSGFAVRNNNPRDPWGSAIDVSEHRMCSSKVARFPRPPATRPS